MLRLTGRSYAWRAALIALTFVGALAAAGSGLVYASPYSPLLVVGAVGALAGLVAWLRRPAWALYTAVFVVFLPSGLIPAQTQSTLNRFVTMAALAVWLLDTVTRRRPVVFAGAAVLMLGFVVWSGFTLLWADHVDRAMTILQMYALRLVLFLFLLPNEVGEQKDLDGLMGTLAFSGWVLVLAGGFTVMQQGYTAGTRFQVLDQNENESGILALVALTGILWQALKPGRYRALRKVQAVAFLLLALGLTAMSGSRGSAISFVVTLLAMCLPKSTRTWGALSLLVLVVGLIAAPVIFSTTIERFIAPQEDTLLGGRDQLWQAGWMVVRDQPLQGVGIGNAPYAALPYVMLWRSVLGRDLVSLHNPALMVWAETGIPGLALYLGVLGAAVAGLVRCYRDLLRARESSLEPYMAVASAVFIGYMLSWIKGGGMETAYSYYLMLALLLIPSRLLSPERVSAIDDGAEAGPGRTPAEALEPRPRPR